MRSGRMYRWNLLRGELMRRIILVFMTLALLLSLVACSRVSAPEPECCSICDYIPSHAPCLVNLNTGEVGEIALYEPHRTLVGEIAEEQRGGYFSFMSVAGLRGYLDACVPEAHVTVPDGVEKYEEKYFCSTCRELLEPYAQCGFVLADLRKPETPTIYPVEVGTEFEVRCYKVSIIDDAEGELDITVLGSIPTDE